MKTSLFSLTIFFSTYVYAAPVEHLFCRFQEQEGHFYLKDNPKEIISYVKLESNGLCALGAAYKDENNKLILDMAMFETCFYPKVAELRKSEFGSPSFAYLNFIRPRDRKFFSMGCQILKK